MQSTELLCIGHRGAMGHVPENTLASVHKALELGAYCIEVDVNSVDGRLLVFHDDRLERTTNGVGYLADQSFEYLRSLDAGDGHCIPTLEEVCDHLQFKAHINIELKGPGSAKPVAALIAKLLANGWKMKSILVSSLDYLQLLELRSINSDIPLGIVVRQGERPPCGLANELVAFSLHRSLADISQRLVDDYHANGQKVYVFTVNKTEDILRMYQLGVDGVFTNYPERVTRCYAQGDLNCGWLG